MLAAALGTEVAAALAMQSKGYVACGLVVVCLACGGHVESGFERSGDEGDVTSDAAGGTFVHGEPRTAVDTADAAASTQSSEEAGFDGAGNGGAGLPACEGSCSGCDPELGLCFIRCKGDWACVQAELSCPEDWPCAVLCEGVNACTQADVRCPPGHACSLECQGRSSCTQLSLHCEGELCELSCRDERSCTQLYREPLE